MSDVPELDRLIEEHAIFKTNMRWNRQEALFHGLVHFTLALSASLVPVIIIGPWGLALFPVIWRWVCAAFPKPAPRDPFRRYMVK